MSRWILFAPLVANDEALVNARWVATQTEALAPAPSVVIGGSEAVREALRRALTDEPEPFGVALFGHGDESAVYGADEEAAFDAANASGEWVHAFACRTGVQLAHKATARGVSCYLGYSVSLLVGWTIDELPPALRQRLAGLVIAATAALLRGVRSRRALQRAISDEADALVDWINTHAPDDHLGLGVLADMLVDRIVLTGSAVTA